VSSDSTLASRHRTIFLSLPLLACLAGCGVSESRPLDGGALADSGLRADAGARLDAEVTPDAGEGSLDADVIADAGVRCDGLDEGRCARTEGCEVRTCPACVGVAFAFCAPVGAPPHDCAKPRCPCDAFGQAECEAAPECHAIYRDPNDCPCDAPGCCATFSRCADGPADCAGLDLSCRAPEPYCAGPYVVAYAGACYEGCVRAEDCAPPPVDCAVTPPVLPAFSQACTQSADCAFELLPVDCCGTARAVGVAASDARRVGRAAMLCAAQLGSCDCLPQGVQTDDGQVVPGAEQVSVSCQRGACRTQAAF
jgi:hypothetical protein